MWEYSSVSPKNKRQRFQHSIVNSISLRSETAVILRKRTKRLKKKTYRGGVSKGGTRREENVYNEPNCILTVSLLL